MRTIRIGSGAGYSGDRIEPAVELAEHGALDYLVFECLAERTIALAQQARMQNPNDGYDPLLAARMKAVLPACRAHGVRIVTNMGAANPVSAAEATRRIAEEAGLSGLKIAAVTGDDVLVFAKGADLELDIGSHGWTARQPRCFGERLHRRGADRRGLGRGSRCGHHRPCGRSFVVSRTADP